MGRRSCPATATPNSSDAVDTGYRRGHDELWLSQDQTIAYVVTQDAVEAWPATEAGCA